MRILLCWVLFLNMLHQGHNIVTRIIAGLALIKRKPKYSSGGISLVMSAPGSSHTAAMR